MKLITWNIQWGRGVDGRVDLGRIVATARDMANFDVICLQEVADNFQALDGNDDRDQFAELGRLLPGYECAVGFGLDVAGDNGRRRRFGNVIFSRYRMAAARRIALPWPADPGRKTMPRVAVETTLLAPFGPVRVTTSHLEYYSDLQRRAQANALRALHEEGCERAAGASVAATNTESNATFAPSPQTTDALVVGDFNFPPEDAAYADMTQGGGSTALLDAWRVVHPARAHPSTFCLHERHHAKAPYCCDFAFVSATLAPRLRRITANLATKDSDHQPLLVELEDA